MEQKNKNYSLVFGVVALIAVILVIAVIGYFVSKPRPEVIQGSAEANEYRVSGMVPGRVADLMVKEGMRVNKGDTVVYIESQQVMAKLAQANAAKAAAAAQSRKAQNGARQEQITAAYELYQQALVQEEVMKKSFDRIQNLFDQKVVAAQKYDEVKAKYDAAVAQTKAAKSQYDMAVNGAREEDKAAAAALVSQANGAVQEVESYLGEMYLTAPSDGVVSATFPKVGELVGQGSPIMTIMDLNDIWFTFNIREDYLQGINYGTELSLTIPALGNKQVAATVNYMAVRDSYATWKATKETDQYDAKTFEVRAVPTEAVQGLLPGMTALVNNLK
ncbi:MAG: efflux RND transporter periplasmic adaptor subunit [Bacteroidales bacterium]|nr:efflux RND transporter periplasmic adaptor subunit [Bacteroidales bacterium]